MSTKRQSLRAKRRDLHQRVTLDRRHASDGEISYAKRDSVSTVQSSETTLPETLDDVSDWARRQLQVNRPPPKPVQPMTDQILGSSLQQLDEAVSRFISGPVPLDDDETIPLVSNGGENGPEADGIGTATTTP